MTLSQLFRVSFLRDRSKGFSQFFNEFASMVYFFIFDANYPRVPQQFQNYLHPKMENQIGDWFFLSRLHNNKSLWITRETLQASCFSLSKYFLPGGVKEKITFRWTSLFKQEANIYLQGSYHHRTFYSEKKRSHWADWWHYGLL